MGVEETLRHVRALAAQGQIISIEEGRRISIGTWEHGSRGGFIFSYQFPGMDETIWIPAFDDMYDVGKVCENLLTPTPVVIVNEDDFYLGFAQSGGEHLLVSPDKPSVESPLRLAYEQKNNSRIYLLKRGE